MSDSDANDTDHQPDLDVDAEHEKLDDLGERIKKTRYQSEEDTQPGGEGRVFADEGVRSQVDHGGDTAHHPAD